MDPEKPQRSVQRPWPWLKIFQGVAVAVEDRLERPRRLLEKSGGDLASGDKGA